ncbi:uncharacterized protein LOC107620268 [Arachis ipaensis]|uniref:uncharacterized protein LOC107620268 n=1 Tax=Arachis ipaensis TaxID=130454 RepID=UPI0007AF2ECF|nr:uncharacterized protein LOC107620268 [Arachis ipaensis]
MDVRYGVAVDAIDDYVCIGESTTIECLKKFVEGVILVFEDKYSQKPNSNDVRCLLQMAEGRGFPGIVSGSNNDINVLDCSPIFDDILNDHALEIVFILNGPHLSNQSQSYKGKNASYLHNIKKGKENMWNEHSECCKNALQLYVV